MKSHHLIPIAAALFITGMVSCTKKDVPDPVTPAGMQQKLSATKTCQSIMISVEGPVEIIVEESQTWKFLKRDAAIADFDWNSCATIPCKKSAEQAAFAHRCDYWIKDGHPFWVMISNNVSRNTEVTLTATIAGESFMLGGQYNENGKYSFTMRNPDGTSRLTNLMYRVDGGEPIFVRHSVIDGDPLLNNCFLDFFYSANNGPYGNEEAFQYLKTEMTTGEIFASDDAVSNDAGCPNVSIAVVQPVTFSLSHGNHTVVLSGTLKGNDGEKDVTISEVSTLNISAMGCN